ncbi:hypothetical protein [Streptomyces hebeiensis]
MAGDPKTLPTRIARSYVRRMAESGGSDPFVAMLRAVASEEESGKNGPLAEVSDEQLVRHLGPNLRGIPLD